VGVDQRRFCVVASEPPQGTDLPYPAYLSDTADLAEETLRSRDPFEASPVDDEVASRAVAPCVEFLQECGPLTVLQVEQQLARGALLPHRDAEYGFRRHSEIFGYQLRQHFRL